MNQTIDVKCNFRSGFFCDRCEVSEVAITSPDTTLKSFFGQHFSPQSQRMIFEDTTVHYLPKGIPNSFSNLFQLVIENCGLKRIAKADLTEYDKLTWLILRKNSLMTLPDDLFEGCKSLQLIDFSQNKLEHFSSKLLEPIKRTLFAANFRNNPEIDAEFCKFGTEELSLYRNVEDFMRILDQKKTAQMPNDIQFDNIEHISAHSTEIINQPTTPLESNMKVNSPEQLVADWSIAGSFNITTTHSGTSTGSSYTTTINYHLNIHSLINFGKDRRWAIASLIIAVILAVYLLINNKNN